MRMCIQCDKYVYAEYYEEAHFKDYKLIWKHYLCRECYDQNRKEQPVGRFQKP